MITYNDAAHAVIRAHREAQTPPTHSTDEKYARQYHPVSHDRLSLSKENSFVQEDGSFLIVGTDMCAMGVVSDTGQVTLL